MSSSDPELWTAAFDEGIAEFEDEQHAMALTTFEEAASLARASNSTSPAIHPSFALEDDPDPTSLWTAYLHISRSFLSFSQPTAALTLSTLALSHLRKQSPPLLPSLHPFFDAVRHAACPVSALPLEILQAIFSLAASSDAPEPTPLRISHVCAHWRRVALAQRGLWHTLALRGIPEAAAIAKTRAWFVRSGRAVDEVRIDLHTCADVFRSGRMWGDWDVINEVHPLLPEISSVLLFVKGLVLDHAENENLASFFRAVTGPGLDDLSERVERLTLTDGVDSIGTRIVFPFIDQVKLGRSTGDARPALRTLRLRNVMCALPELARCKLDLVELVIDEVPRMRSILPLHSVLEVNPRLETLVVRMTDVPGPYPLITWPDQSPLGPSPLSMAQLTHLELAGIGSDLGALLKSLAFPALRVLRLLDEPLISELLHALLCNAGTNLAALEELSISVPSFFEPLALVETLVHARGLRRLHLHDIPYRTNEVLEVLSRSPAEVSRMYEFVANPEAVQLEITCPKLTELVFVRSDGIQSSSLTNMIKRRRTLEARTEGARKVDAVSSVRLRECASSGLDGETLNWLQEHLLVFENAN
ncbi:hypothetical protein FA95DRAFT_1598080 [Auriscalpium vulgare]|uniref:Uncharacterized protein n=1 Tax=Auriscalpium vulgare TaxID=40419 RepID=A0ACB8RGA9_9AGAM|nr:hypothetical protein FA95DRAFT_1598080 [Auriscalpium vulgare]